MRERGGNFKSWFFYSTQQMDGLVILSDVSMHEGV